MLFISCKFSRSRITGLLAARPSSPARDLDLVHEWLTLRSMRLSLMIIFGQVLDPAAHLFVSALPGLVMCVGPADPPPSPLYDSPPLMPPACSCWPPLQLLPYGQCFWRGRGGGLVFVSVLVKLFMVCRAFTYKIWELLTYVLRLLGR